MILDPESAIRLADYLLQIKAIKLQPKNPFTWASGIQSPIYCDNRIVLSFPAIRTFIRQEMTKVIQKEMVGIDAVVGVATGGIAIGALVAEELGLPFAYVRSKGKDHGMKNRIEGILNPGQRVVVIEDLISSGGSSLSAVEAVRDAECTVNNMMAIFTYGFERAVNSFADQKVKLYTLADYPTMIERAVHHEYVSEADVNYLTNWRKEVDKEFNSN